MSRAGAASSSFSLSSRFVAAAAGVKDGGDDVDIDAAPSISKFKKWDCLRTQEWF
jgi:hypothetical protein